jgi:hypothetical protein
VVRLKSAAGLTTQESVTVSTTKGFIGTASTLSGGTSAKSITLVGAADGVNTLYLIADGTSGTATISVKSTSVTFTNKIAVFYGSTVAKITAVQLGKTLGATASSAAAPKLWQCSQSWSKSTRAAPDRDMAYPKPCFGYATPIEDSQGSDFVT